MAHHGDSISEKLLKSLGATGKFPEGHLNADDEGEIRIAVGLENNKVVINFGKEIAWIGFTKQQARDLANMILEKARQIE